MDLPSLDNRPSRHSRIELHDTVVQREPGRRPIVGCPATRRYLEVTEASLQAIEALRVHGTIDAAEAALREQTGEEVELTDFVVLLRDRDIVRSIDDEPASKAQDARARHPWLHKIAPERLSWLRSPWLLLPVAATILAWLAFLVTEPGIRPHSHDMLLSDRPGLNMVFIFGGLIVMAYLHELAHFFTARSYGIDATISFSHRFYMLVLHTDVTNAWTLPKRARLAIFLAGMTFNLFVAGLIGLLFAADPLWLTPLAEKVLRYVVMLNTFPLVFQLFIFARTDLYHVALVLTGERNLARDSVSFLMFRLRRRTRLLLGRGRDHCGECTGTVQEQDPFCFRCGAERDLQHKGTLPFEYRSRRVLTAWGVVQGVGTVFGILFMLTLGLPAIVRNLGFAAGLLRDHTDLLGFAEGFLAFALVAMQLCFLAWFLGRAVLGLAGRVALATTTRALRFTLARLSPKALGALTGYVVALGYPALQAKGLVPTPEQAQAQAQAQMEALAARTALAEAAPTAQVPPPSTAAPAARDTA